MVQNSNGARGRSDAIEWNQTHSIVQPGNPADGNLPRPEPGLSNLRPLSSSPRMMRAGDER